MGLLKPAVNQTAFLKAGLLGFEGSGKTFTAVELAIGMTKLTKGTKVAWFDTEKGSDFHIERFKKEGVHLDVVKSRSFKDLVDTIREAEANGYSFLIIDSITHVWRDLVDSWLRKKNRQFLTMKDWGVLKTEWGLYTDLYVNSKLSIAMLGRAGHEYDMEEDEDGNQEIKKSGTKMKVETETGYEPDLLIEMFKAPKITTTTIKGKKRVKKERGFINKCVILKDRTDMMNGAEFEMPKFKHFEKIIKCLNIGGDHQGTDLSRNSEGIFKDPDYSYAHKEKMRSIQLELLQEALILGGLDGTSKDAKEGRIKLLIEIFGDSSKTKIENMDPLDLQNKIRLVREKLGLDKGEPPVLDTDEKIF